MDEWFAAPACAGFVLAASSIPGAYDDIVAAAGAGIAEPRPVPQGLRRPDRARQSRPADPPPRRLARRAPTECGVRRLSPCSKLTVARAVDGRVSPEPVICHARNERSGTGRRGILPKEGYLMLWRRDWPGRRGWPSASLGGDTDASARYLAAVASGCAAAAGRFSLRNPRTCRSAIWICLGFAFHGYRVTWAFGAR
jgi:hypothetical protein